MDYRTSSTSALPKKFGTSTATSIYDGVFSGSAPFRPSSFSSRVEDFGEIFGGSGESRRASSIPVLDVPALHERKVSVDVRSSRLEYSKIFGGSGGPEGGALSFEDLIGEPKKVRSLTREERNRAGARSPSEVSVSGSEDNQVLQRPSDHTSNKAKRFNLSYNQSHGGSKDGTDGMTHITQLHDVPGFARVIDESNPLKQATGGKSGANDACSENGSEKSKSSISHSTPEKQNKDVCRDGSHSNGFDAYESGPRTGSFVMGTPSPSRFFSKFDSKGDSRYEASPSNASEDGAGSSSPPYFDEEVDANSAAAESAAAVRKAIEQAQARINVAKELMEKRKDLFQGKALFKGMGTEKRKEGKKVKRANKFSEMEPPGMPEGADIPKQMFKENEKPNCLVMPDIVEQKKRLNGKNILGGTLEFRCTETRAQACTKLGDLVEGDEANETKSLEEKQETSVEKIIPRVDDYEMQRTITTELSEIPVGIVIPQEIHDRSKVCTVTVAPECGMHRIDSGSAEQLHYVEDDKMGLEVGHEQLESAVTFRVNNEQGECQENIQELHEIEFEKQLETQHVDCVWEENGKKPGEGCEQKQENISSGRDEIREEDENRDRLGEFCEDGEDGKNSVGNGIFEENETECDSFYSEAENDLLDHCQETLHETSDGFLDGGETIGLQDEDQVESNYQHDTHEQAENANIPIEVDLQIDIGNHEIQVVSRCQENLIDGAEECSRSADGNLIGTVEASGYDSVEGYFNVSGSKVEPKENERMTDTANLSVQQNEKLVTDNTDSEEKEESNFSVEKKDSAVVDNYNSEETCGLEAFHLSWCSLDVNEIKKQQEVTEITGLNENTVKSRFTGINMGQCQSDQNAEEPKPTVFDLGNHEGGLVSEMHFCDHREKEETSSSQKEDEASSSQKEEEEDEASSSQKEEVHYYINQDEIEAEFSDDYDSLLDSEVIVEAECQPDSSERKDEIAGETTEEKSSHIINQEEENWPTEMAKEQKTGNSMTMEGEPVRDSFEKTDEEKERDKEREKEREREREREKERMAVERAIREARERAFVEARERAERAAVEKATAEARQRVMAQAREKLEKASAETVDGPAEKKSIEARLRAQRAAVERATAEARERALEKALSEKLSGTVKDNKVRQKPSHEQQQKSSSSSTNFRNSSSSSHGGPSSGERYEGANGESAQRSKARLERHQRTAERAAEALAEKNMRDLLAQREQAERNRLAEALDSDIKRWSSGKHGNLRALLSTLQYILGPDSGWQPVSLTEIVTTAAVKKAYRRATLCVHPDKLQQRGASLQQKYICEKVFDLLKEAWNRFTAEEK